MTVIILSYLGTAYVSSGLICSLASQKYQNQSSESRQIETKQGEWNSIAIVLIWPIWIISQIN